MERAIRFPSGDLELSGVLHLPETTRDGQLPCFVVIHGFGSNKDATNVQGPVKMLNEWGYAAFRFDMRGCGQSDGSFGRVICLEQVADTRAAIDLLQAQPELDPQRIGVLGSSFGAAVAIYAAGVDDRIAAVVSSGGWGHGERKFRRQHPTQEGWLRFTEMLERGSLHREQTGESLQFPAEVAQSMYNFCAEDVVGDISPRPLLLLHSSKDSITPTEQSVALFEKAGMPVDLHLFAETDHFMFSEENVRVREIVRRWLDRFLPVDQLSAQRGAP
jgi:dipeptidyl aminopeptidase/acylaminoacyl peptidase